MAKNKTKSAEVVVSSVVETPVVETPTTTEPISTRFPEVTIEYDSRGKRVTKKFEDAVAAKSFFVQKDKESKNPKVISGEVATTEAAPTTVKTPKPKKAAKGRPFYAGLVVEKHYEHIAADGKFTPEMVSEVDRLAGVNSKESEAWLRISFNVLSGAREACSETVASN